jgi:putative oxidoreductase
MTDSTTDAAGPQGVASSERHYIPALGGIYAATEHYTEPLLRLGLAAILIPKGLQKVFGMFGGGGIGGTAELFDRLGYSPGILWGTLVGFTELIAGILFLIGLFVRPAAFAIFIFMIFALHFTWTSNGWFWLNGGAEFNWLITMVTLVLLIRGAGELSVDKRMDKEF